MDMDYTHVVVQHIETATAAMPSWRQTPGGIFVDYGLPYLLIVLSLVAMVLTLRFGYGRVWWCKCGKSNPWNGDIKSMHNSQHVADPYSFSHFLHGVLFYWCVYFIPHITIHHKAAIVLITAVLWELVENSKWVINRYRENTVSYGYEGDSIVNSIADCICCMLGFMFSHWHSWYVCLIVGILDEAMLAYWIHDNMIINALMLVYKFKCIADWQAELEKRRGSVEKTGGGTNGSGDTVDGETTREPEENKREEKVTFIDNSV